LCDPDSDIRIAGNASGLAQLGRILLQCALDTPDARNYRSCGPAAEALRKLSVTGSDLRLTAVDLLAERPVAPTDRRRIPDRLALLGCGILVFAVGFIFLMGLGVVTGVIPIGKR
jgi:hypothetical protein